MPAYGAIASAFGAYLSYQGQSNANQTNRDIATENRDFQQYMSNTAHRREVRDLIAAGLNPMLSVTKGQGATTPNPPIPTMHNPHQNSAQASQAAALIGAQIKKLNAEANQADATATQTTAMTPGAPGLQESQTGHYRASAGQAAAHEANIRQQMTNFPNVVNNVIADTLNKEAHAHLATAMRDMTLQQRLVYMRTHEEKMPAEIRELLARAEKLIVEAQQLRLELPEYLKRSEFWKSPAGTVKPYGEILRDIPLRRR